MLGAVLATLCFALSSVAAKQAVHRIGSSSASLFRLMVAASLLAIASHIWGVGFQGPKLIWFLISGFVGYGICDTAIFLALPRLGAQLTSLMVQCLAAPIAAATEWIWLGTRLDSWAISATGLILIGVTWALLPVSSTPRPTRRPDLGLFSLVLGLVAAAGQGVGAVLSRQGQFLSRKAGFPIDPISVSFQRIVAGVVFGLLWWWLQRRPGAAKAVDYTHSPVTTRGSAAFWVILNAVIGPFLGVICYQWALQRQPTGLVLSLTALTPLAVIPLSWGIEGERPTRRSLVGGCVAVAGVLILTLRR